MTTATDNEKYTDWQELYDELLSRKTEQQIVEDQLIHLWIDEETRDNMGF